MDEVRASETLSLKSSARDSLGQFLASRKWTHFATQTFASPQRFPLTAIQKTARALGLNHSRPVVRAFLGAEQHHSGLWHAHGLVYMPWAPEAELSRMERLGFARLEPVRMGEAVSLYVAKYVTKDAGEWQLYGDKRAWDMVEAAKLAADVSISRQLGRPYGLAADY